MWEACSRYRCRRDLRAVVVCLIVMLAASCGRSTGGPIHGETRRAARLTIKGSDTMVHLVSMWAEAYMDQHAEVDISVTGGGSGTGFAALINGTTDICAASREIFAKEREAARQHDRELTEWIVARDGLAIIVHPSNPVTELSLDQVQSIYNGSCSNWRQVGGPDLAMVVLSRDSSSGTYSFFQEFVLGRADFRRDARLLAATAAIVEEVSQNAGAIGYVGLAYAGPAPGGDSVKSLRIGPRGGAPAVEPMLSSVTSGVYPLARPLRFYTTKPHDEPVEQFISFCVSQTGQEIVRRSGYAGVK